MSGRQRNMIPKSPPPKTTAGGQAGAPTGGAPKKRITRADEQRLVDAFRRLGELLAAQPRKGLVVTAYGRLRVGTWVSKDGRVTVNPELPTFQEAFDRLKREGISKTEPRPARRKLKNGRVICTVGWTTMKLEEAALGDLDCALKAEGYCLTETN